MSAILSTKISNDRAKQEDHWYYFPGSDRDSIQRMQIS